MGESVPDLSGAPERQALDLIFAVCLKCHPLVFELPLYFNFLKSKSKGADLMRVLIACAIVISTALGLAGCFHHQQAVVQEPLPPTPIK